MRALVLALTCALAAGCGGGSGPPAPELTNTGPGGTPGESVDLEPQAARPTAEFVGTGEAFDGPFSLGDELVTMTAAGEFSRVRSNGKTDGGSYLVTEDGKLVLFVERIGESKLTTVLTEVHSRADLLPAP